MTKPVTGTLAFSVSTPDEMWREAITGVPAERVSRSMAIRVPAVKKARDLICGTLGALPAKAYNAKREEIDNPLLAQPERGVARSVTMTRIVEDMLFEEVCWLQITEFGPNGYPSKVKRLRPRSVDVRQVGAMVQTRDGHHGQTWEYVPDSQLIRIDSPNDGLLIAGAPAILDALLLARTASGYAKDPMPLGYFAPISPDVEPGTEAEVQDILDKWAAARRNNSWGYVNGSLKAETLTWSPQDLQLGDARDYAVVEIARLTGLDADELSVNTTTRTYVNAEQRRLDLIDFTLAPYITAIEDRLSMEDVTPRGHKVRFDFAGFLRSDTLTRLQTYQLGRTVGVYDSERIAKIENIPSAEPEVDISALARQVGQQPAPQERPTQAAPTQGGKP